LIFNNFPDLLEEFKKQKISFYRLIRDLYYFIQSIINISRELNSKYPDFSKDHKLKNNIKNDYIFKIIHQSLEYFSVTLLPNLIENKQNVINFIKLFGSPLPINEFKTFNNQISLISIQEFEIFNKIITSLQGIFTKIHKHLKKFNNKALLKFNKNENLLTIGEKLIDLYVQYEKNFPQ
jgi:hypothetical protein